MKLGNPKTNADVQMSEALVTVCFGTVRRLSGCVYIFYA